MRKILTSGFIFLIGLIFVSIGCGGGGGGLPILPPSTTDLAGLEGIWDFEVDLDGKITVVGIPSDIEESRNGYFVFTKLSVNDLLGNTITWSYDGHTLWLRWTEVVDVDTPYGHFNSDRTYTFKMNIEPSDTEATIGGDVVGYLTIPIYGKAKETLDVSGTLTKRL
jgi:hypothetical protein